MKVVDTNIVAYLLLEGPHSAAARDLHAADDDWHSESFLMVELVSVLAKTMRIAGLSLAQSVQTLVDAQRLLLDCLHDASGRDVLEAAATFGVSAYDARFLVVARALGEPLVTEDAKLRRAAPELTCSLDEALAR
jgi:predicted nucleic acid-binding protein